MEFSLASTPPTEKEIEIARRYSILHLQEAMMALEDRLDIEKDLPLRHFFAPGVYGREITIPKGVLVVGKIHKHSHINIISAGKVRVATEFGDEDFSAPYTFISKPGTKRAVLALEDTIWTTIHVTDKTDLAEVEEEVIAPTFKDYFKFIEEQKLLEDKGEKQ